MQKATASIIVKVGRKMTTFNPPFFRCAVALTFLTPKGVEAPTFRAHMF